MVFDKWMLIFLAAAICYAQALAPPRQVDVLQRSVELSSFEGTASYAAEQLLVQSRVAGGITLIYDECAQPDTKHFSFPRGTLRRGLDYISTTDSSWKWTYSDGVVLVARGNSDKTILNTIIRAADISPKDAPSVAAQRLLQAPEVRAAINKAGLEEMVPPIGFSAMRPTGEGSAEDSAAIRPKHLQNVTLESALNSVAAMHGAAVWRYEQFKCGKKSSYRIGWAAY